jgi:hypothetical protein
MYVKKLHMYMEQEVLILQCDTFKPVEYSTCLECQSKLYYLLYNEVPISCSILFFLSLGLPDKE